MLTKLNFLQKKILSLSVWITVSLRTWIFLFTFAWLLIAYSNLIYKKFRSLYHRTLFRVTDLKFIKVHYGHYSYNPNGDAKSTRIIRKIYCAKLWASKDFAACLLDVSQIVVIGWFICLAFLEFAVQWSVEWLERLLDVNWIVLNNLCKHMKKH